jgi:hypothetical protein
MIDRLIERRQLQCRENLVRRQNRPRTLRLPLQPQARGGKHPAR